MAPEVTIPTSNELVRGTRPEFERMIRPLRSASLAQLRCYEPAPTVRPAAAAAPEAGSGEPRVGVEPNPWTVDWLGEVSLPAMALVSCEADLPGPTVEAGTSTSRQPGQRRFSQGGSQ